MANTDKNIIITPNNGSVNDPTIVFSGADATTAEQSISLNVYPTNSGTLSFEGTAGQLFSITNSMDGTIFSVNDVSGIPSIEVIDTGLVKVAEYSGNVVLGSALDNGTDKLQVTGNIISTGTVLGSNLSGTNTGDQVLTGLDYEPTGTAASTMTTHTNTHPAPTVRDARNQVAGSYEPANANIQAHVISAHAPSNATADQTAAQILTALKTVDGVSSGLDADLLDGQQGSYYNQSQYKGSSFTSRNNGNVLSVDSATENMSGYTNNSSAAGYADGGLFVAAYSTSWVSQIFSNFRDGHLSVRGKNSGTWQPWYKVWDAGNDGAGSGLDADKLDAQEGSYYLNYNNFTNTPTIPSLSGYATESYVGTQISNLVDSSPAALNTLNELAAALGDDANFSTTVTNSIATKMPLAGGTMTGDIIMGANQVDFNAGGGNATSPQIIGDRSTTNLDSRVFTAEGGLSYTTFDANTLNKPSHVTNNANGVLTINTHSGSYNHQLAFTNNGNIAHRSRDGGGLSVWKNLLTDLSPNAPSITSTTTVNDTIEIVFAASTSSGQYATTTYEVWSDDGTGSDYSLIAKIAETDIAPSMSVIDSSFDTDGTISYRIYAIRHGVYSTAATTTHSFTMPSLDVSNMSVIPDINNYHIQYDLPDTRFLDHIEIYVDAEAVSGNLTRVGASLAYSGDNPSFRYNISSSDLGKYHQFWVEVVTV